MDVWTHDRWRFPLPETHNFPIDKYHLLRERVVADGTVAEHELHEAEAVPWPWLEAVHDPGLVARIRHDGLSVREQRGLGLPWSPALVERSRRSVAGTVAAARFAARAGIGMNLGGGTHHAGRTFARGYCVFNDVAVALSRLRAEGLAPRALIVDCDVHQGDGTADLLGPDPDTFTLSLHGARNYPFQRIPSDLDVDIAVGTGDDRYLTALDEALDHAIPRARPQFAFYLAGADPWEGDRLGKLALTKAGLRARDELVLDRLRAAGASVCVVLAGGYAEDVRDTVDIHAATVSAAARRIEPRRELAR
jgi:acetoin utilization deacetylase AcuC-like enzyme